MISFKNLSNCVAAALFISIVTSCATGPKQLKRYELDDFFLKNNFVIAAYGFNDSEIYIEHEKGKIWKYDLNTKQIFQVYDFEQRVVQIAKTPDSNFLLVVTKEDNLGKIKQGIFKIHSLDLKSQMPKQIFKKVGGVLKICGFDKDKQTLSILFAKERYSSAKLYQAKIREDSGRFDQDPKLILGSMSSLDCGSSYADQNLYFDLYSMGTDVSQQRVEFQKNLKLLLKNRPGVFAISNDSSEFLNVFYFSGKTGAKQKTFEKWDTQQLVVLNKHGRNVVITNENGYSRLKIWNEIFTSAQQVNIPYNYFEVLDVNTSQELLLIRAESDNVPTELFQYNWKTTELVPLTAFNKLTIPKEHLATATSISTQSEDGLSISSVLWEPKAELKNEIAIIDIHGGPEDQIFPTYSDEIQFLVNQGFTVVQPNFRGSTGYGTDFRRKYYQDYGGGQMADIDSVRNFLIRERNFNPKRIAITGASFGGYSAATAIFQKPSAYCAAVSQAGFFDIPLHIKEKGSRESAKRVYGDPINDIEKLKMRSPFYNLKEIQTPILIIYGELDDIVEKNQSENFIKELELNEKKYKRIIYDDEGHWLKKSRNYNFHIKKILEFIKSNCS